MERRWGVAPPKRVRVIPLAPALPAGHEDPPTGGPYLLAVGDLRAKKNLTRLVQAYARLRAGGLEQRLVLAGLDSGEGERLRHRRGRRPAGAARATSRDPELDALLRGADALVHPSLYEGFGFVLLEAMERGTPRGLLGGHLPARDRRHGRRATSTRWTWTAMAAAITRRAGRPGPLGRGRPRPRGRRSAGTRTARATARRLPPRCCGEGHGADDELGRGAAAAPLAAARGGPGAPTWWWSTTRAATTPPP